MKDLIPHSKWEEYKGVAYELIPMYTPIPKGRQLNVNYKSWIAPLEGRIFRTSH